MGECRLQKSVAGETASPGVVVPLFGNYSGACCLTMPTPNYQLINHCQLPTPNCQLTTTGFPAGRSGARFLFIRLQALGAKAGIHGNR